MASDQRDLRNRRYFPLFQSFYRPPCVFLISILFKNPSNTPAPTSSKPHESYFCEEQYISKFMLRKSYGSDLRLPCVHPTNASRQKVFGVTQQELAEFLATVRKFMKQFLEVTLPTTAQEARLIQVENAVKEEYPEMFGSDEYKMWYLRQYIYSHHSATRSAYYRRLKKKGEMVDGRRRAQIGGHAVTTVGEGGTSVAGGHLEISHAPAGHPYNSPMRQSQSGDQQPL
ncbi:hypothetical protein K443DRAFT_179166 [Laccaria amethystina LaAM-08-1]|uniref:Uncharacterized protein n=1 Tax=Laccaria amethystina LaAM-08-1 TaxID=1095629 RepID=A0A0C9XCC9_9AGAR|nr:hypothetical protein K443DRAFT_179166 [Laccaria amethystina LaAM-08-1]